MRFPRARTVAYFIFFIVLIVAAVVASRNQFEKLFASFTSAQTAGKGPAVVTPGANPAGAPAAPKLPTIIRMGSGTTPSALIPSSQTNVIEIVDANTFRVDGQSYRLAGIDTPETGIRANCAAERDLSARALRRLREIVAGGNLMLSRESCQCPPGTEGKLACNQGMLCGALWSANSNVGQMLIDEGLAKKFECTAGRCPPKPKWC